MHFNSSEEAVAFGTFAAKKTRSRLERARVKFLKITSKFKNDGNFDKAMEAAVQAQFCREALCAGMIPVVIG